MTLTTVAVMTAGTDKEVREINVHINTHSRGSRLLFDSNMTCNLTDFSTLSQVVMVGSGAAAVTTSALARPFPNSLSMPWRLGRMHGQP